MRKYAFGFLMFLWGAICGGLLVALVFLSLE